MKTLTIVILLLLLICTINAGEWKVVKDGYWGAVTEELLERLLDLINSKDYNAIQELQDLGLVFPIKTGLVVQVVDSSNWGSLIKVRPREINLTFWTVIEAIGSK